MRVFPSPTAGLVTANTRRCSILIQLLDHVTKRSVLFRLERCGSKKAYEVLINAGEKLSCWPRTRTGLGSVECFLDDLPVTQKLG